MFKRILAALLCTVMTAAAVTSCGKDIDTDDKSSSSSEEAAENKEDETSPAAAGNTAVSVRQ